MKTNAFLAASALTACVIATPASASYIVSTFTDFEAFTPGSVNGQGGWSVTNPSFDQAVVSLSGNNVWRFSNAYATGSFGDQPFAPRPGGLPTNPPGSLGDVTNNNPQAFAGQASTGALHRAFFGEFDFRSVSTGAVPGLFISVSPDNGQGGRMGYVGLSDNGSSGIDLITYNIDNAGGFVGPIPIATVGYGAWHTVRTEIQFGDGAEDDLVKYFLDGSLIYSVGTSWEQFYAVNQPLLHPYGVPVQTMLFRSGGTGVPAALDGGFYFDNVTTGFIPEPNALAFLGLGLLGVSFACRRRSVQRPAMAEGAAA